MAPLQNVLSRSRERNPQGKDNVPRLPSVERPSSPGGDAIECKQRRGGLLKYYIPGSGVGGHG